MAGVSDLSASRREPCPDGMTRVSDTDLCTHGDDPAPPGLDEDELAPLLPEQRAVRMAGQLDCIGDGTSGPRVQVLYVYTGTSRYAEVLPSLQGWTAGIDAIVNNSAAKTSGVRHVRFVHDGNCAPVIPEVRVSQTGFSGMISDLRAKGFNRTDRQYVIWADTTNYCGIGTVSGTDEGPGYARVDRGCWSSMTASHELFHTLGAVSNQAPNASGGFHCIDEYDVMCYRDDPYYPTMRYDCPDRSSDQLLDCGDDDYFSTNPPAGSWLATHWNTANSHFLSASVGSAPPIPTTSPPTPTPTPTPKPKPCRGKKKKNCHKKSRGRNAERSAPKAERAGRKAERSAKVEGRRAAHRQ